MSEHPYSSEDLEAMKQVLLKSVWVDFTPEDIAELTPERIIDETHRWQEHLQFFDPEEVKEMIQRANDEEAMHEAGLI